MAKVIILGSNGQMGQDLVEVFQDSKHEVVAITRNDFDAEMDSLEKLSAYIGADYIINGISYHNTDECEDQLEKAFKLNVSFVYELSKFCHKNNMTLFHVTTDYVFSGEASKPYLEDDKLGPLSIYATSKATSEFIVKEYACKYFIFRVSSLFGRAGSGGRGQNFVETMIRLAKEGKSLKVIADQYMSPTHTLDIARAMRSFVDQNVSEYGIYHCCNSGSCSWFEFTKTIFESMGLRADLSQTSYDQYKTKAKRPKYSVLNNEKISKYYKMPNWKDALREYLKRKNYI